MAKSRKSNHQTIVAPEPVRAQVVKLGTIVLYRLMEADAQAINQRRLIYTVSEPPQGVQIFSGHQVEEGETYPMIVTRVTEYDSVNGQVFLDGSDTLWVRDAVEGTDPGTYAVD